jgi:hypothetical protein
MDTPDGPAVPKRTGASAIALVAKKSRRKLRQIITRPASSPEKPAMPVDLCNIRATPVQCRNRARMTRSPWLPRAVNRRRQFTGHKINHLNSPTRSAGGSGTDLAH